MFRPADSRQSSILLGSNPGWWKISAPCATRVATPALLLAGTMAIFDWVEINQSTLAIVSLRLANTEPDLSSDKPDR